LLETLTNIMFNIQNYFISSYLTSVSAIAPGEKRPIRILTHGSKAPANAPCKVLATAPNGKTTDLPTKKTPEGFETTFAPLETGPHVVRVNFDNKEVPDSPFKVDVVATVDLAKVQIKGLEKGKLEH